MIVDRLTKVARFIPVQTEYHPHQYAELYFEHIVVLPYQIVDLSSLPIPGSVFTSKLVLIWFEVLHIIHKLLAKLNVLTKS